MLRYFNWRFFQSMLEGLRLGCVCISEFVRENGKKYVKKKMKAKIQRWQCGYGKIDKQKWCIAAAHVTNRFSRARTCTHSNESIKIHTEACTAAYGQKLKPAFRRLMTWARLCGQNSILVAYCELFNCAKIERYTFTHIHTNSF